MIKFRSRWIRGKNKQGKTLLSDAEALKAQRSAQARKQPNYSVPIRTREDVCRRAIVQWLRWGVTNTSRIHYSQGSWRMDAINHPGQLPLFTDCSAFVTLCYKWAMAPDPNGLGYNGTGYTGTLLSHMNHIERKDVKPGDLIVYGGGTGNHVVGVDSILPDGDFRTVSHGQEAGPFFITHSQEHRAQGNGPVVFLSLPSWKF